jgi:hypothetical protein
MNAQVLADRLRLALPRHLFIALLMSLEQDPEELRKRVQGQAINNYPEAFTDEGLLREEQG